ncbi:MAG: pyridoxamine 5'-phosphate oxidase family protein [Arenibacter sp.]|uniref:pyridoxamine 5'-phosphate oxidase family protein n=1 Tax=Arenibacter amylolyticus TaxID=1406873 RepID=UPI000A367116|nr:pyridoxamine 5'-phosphate oxidase family protein [Arenibacter amylolyticus]MDX1327276.1 pyridoxamine 5'-phosphate oxidase family protein [Arenibacter sp.]
MMKDINEAQCIEVLQNHCMGYLAYMDHDTPYVLPITYYYNPEEKCIISISGEGHKMRCIREHPSVALNVSNKSSLKDWQSVMVHGEVEEIKGSNSKYQLHQFLQGVKRISGNKENVNLQFISDFSSKNTEGGTSVVYRIKIKEITGKQRKPK